MSFIGGNPIFRPAGELLDQFGRLRTSNVETLFENSFDQTDRAQYFHTLSTGGSQSRDANTSAMRLTTTAATGQRVVRQSKLKMLYQPGKSMRLVTTFNLNPAAAAQANVTKRIGVYDDGDGVFLEQSGTSVRIVRRSSTSGSPVDNAIAQASWDDPMDGTGASGVTIDWTKTQLMVIDIAWLGVGGFRLGFLVDGTLYYAHEYTASNSLAIVYMKSARLPIRAEILTDSVTPPGAGDRMDMICQCVMSEGGQQYLGTDRGVGNGTTPLSLGAAATGVPIAVRIKSTTPRAFAALEEVLLGSDSNVIGIGSIIVGGTLPGSPTWSSPSSDSPLEITTNLTGAVTGGTVIKRFNLFTTNTGGDQSPPLSNQLKLTYDDLNGTPEVLALQVYNSANTRNYYGAMNLKEFF